MDHEKADYEATVDQAKSRFGKKVLPVQYPLNTGNGFNTIVDALLDFSYDYIDVDILFVEAFNLALDVLLEDLVLEFGLAAVLASNHTHRPILIYTRVGRLVISVDLPAAD